MTKRVVLAYSGGLDTSVAVHWLRKEMGVEVVCLAADVGQGGDWEAVKERAYAAGAIEAIVADLRDEFAADYCFAAISANAKYEGQYPLVSALSRPVIAKKLVEVAREFDAQAVAHGCTGKGNDQVRFEVSTRALAPDLDVIAPVRHWGLSRRDCISIAAEEKIPITVSEDKPYSIDDNLFGRAIECGEMEDPWNAPPDWIWEMTRPRETQPRSVVVSFEKGKPTAIDGLRLGPREIITEMNDIVGAYGFGRIDMVENRRVGIKSRETYEAPGALALIMAHQDLEGICLERDIAHEKMRLEPRFTELAYDGLWFSPLMNAINAFIEESQQYVTGDVRLELAPFRCYSSGRRSDLALYDYGLATYEAEDSFRHADSEGFVRLWGLGIQTWATRQSRKMGA